MPTAYAARRAEPHLMAEINTTPIIDVMLVLLVMMLLSLPAPTHKVAVDLPQAGATAQTPYARFDALIIVVKRAGIEEIGFKGNDAFRTF